MDSQQWIFLSPHFDDVALSCGGLVWDIANQGGEVQVWTVMAGYPPGDNYSTFAQKNHLAWGKSGRDAIDMRREEDKTACRIMGAVPRHFNWPDVIYRNHQDSGMPVVNNDEELFKTRPEPSLVDEIEKTLAKEIPQKTFLVLPMGLGGHLDHRVVVQAGARLQQVDFYYADYPYILSDFSSTILADNRIQKVPRILSEDALQAWQDAVLSYRSQLSAFWRDDNEGRLALRNYLSGGGGRLWKKIEVVNNLQRNSKVQ